MNVSNIMEIIRKNYSIDSPEGYRFIQNIFIYVNNLNLSKEKTYSILSELIGDNYKLSGDDLWNLINDVNTEAEALSYTE